ncbi:ABC transporter permease [Flavobacterium sp.]|uniref:ABC transporter permease n=1 Tax=Flavobacterium sp. TaxID=239 RepID=UPI003B991CD2
MSLLKLIIKREFIAKVRNKSFIVMTFLSPLIFVVIAAVVGYLASMKADLRRIAVHDPANVIFNTLKSTEEYRYVNTSGLAVAVLRDSVKAEKFDGLLVVPATTKTNEIAQKTQYYSNESAPLELILDLEDQLSEKLTAQNYQAAGIDTLAINKAQADVSIQLKKSSGEDTIKGASLIRIIIGGGFGYLIMMFIIIYGNLVMRSVIEEKTNRIIEIIISSVKPFQLMLGKIIGTSLAGLLQFGIWIVLGITLLTIASAVFGIETGGTAGIAANAAAEQVDPSKIQQLLAAVWDLPIATILISFVLYFIGGYFLYSSFYAAIGAAVDNETDSQQFLLPIIMPLVLGVYIGFFTVINDPHGTVATVFSIVPLTSPIVMLMRIPFGVPIWQVILSIVLLFATFVLVVWFAAKIYRVGILMYGKKPTWKEIIKWTKYD